MNKFIKLLQLYAIGAREGESVNILKEKPKPVKTRAAYEPHPAQDFFNFAPFNSRGLESAVTGPSISYAALDASRSPSNRGMVNRIISHHSAIGATKPIKNKTPVLKTPKKVSNNTPMPAVMQELYNKILVKGHPIKILSHHNGVFTISISDVTKVTSANSIYILSPEGIRTRPMSFKDRDHVKVLRLG